MTASSVVVEYPIKEIFTDLAKYKGILFRYFDEDDSLTQFPILSDLSTHFSLPPDFRRELKRQKASAFESHLHNHPAFAYFGREVLEFSNVLKEHGVIHSEGRRIYVALNENGNGRISISDLKVRRARDGLGRDSFGSNYDKHPEAEYGFRQEFGTNLNGVRAFLEALVE